MKRIINHIKTLSDNNFEFYGAIAGLLLSTIAAVLAYNWRKIKVIYYLSCFLFLLVGLILVYSGHFRHIKPFRFSMLLSITVTLITGLIVVVYLRYLKSDTGFSMPIAYISQLALANLVKHIFNLNNRTQ